MTLYVVSKTSQEKSSAGIIERVDEVVYGVFTTEERANRIAARWGAVVTPFIADQESRKVIDQWLNPGYAAS